MAGDLNPVSLMPVWLPAGRSAARRRGSRVAQDKNRVEEPTAIAALV
jgi:hypothetical protein